MSASVSYVDLGAVQRIETGVEAALTNYVDLGAVQRQETVSGAARSLIIRQAVNRASNY